jgi:hypothetical protein
VINIANYLIVMISMAVPLFFLGLLILAYLNEPETTPIITRAHAIQLAFACLVASSLAALAIII